MQTLEKYFSGYDEVHALQAQLHSNMTNVRSNIQYERHVRAAKGSVPLGRRLERTLQLSHH